MRPFASGAILSWCVILAGSPGYAEEPLPLPEIVKRAAPAVVSLRAFDAAGGAIGLGSGFLVDGGRVVTNAHVVQGAARVEVFDHNGNLLGGTDYAEALSSRTDLAVLPAMPDPPAVLELATDEPSVGDTIIAIGSPQGLTNTVSNGIVSAFRDNEGVRWMQISAPISQGSSGGPILDDHGRVVAVSVAVLREGQNLNFAIPARNVRALVGSPRGRIALGGGEPRRAEVPQRASVSGETPKAEPRVTDPQALLRRLPNLTLNEVHEGRLDEADQQLESGSRIDAFRFDAQMGEAYTVLVFSREVDVVVAAYDPRPDGTTESLGFDDDGAGDTNSRLVFRAKRNGPAGVVVSSSTPGELGAYAVVVARGEVPLKGPAEQKQSRWERVARADDRELSLDRTSLQRLDGGRVRCWQRTDYTEWQHNRDGEQYNSNVALVEHDCTRKRSRFLRVHYYSDKAVIDSYEADGEAEWNPWVPESVGEGMGSAACAREAPPSGTRR